MTQGIYCDTLHLEHAVTPVCLMRFNSLDKNSWVEPEGRSFSSRKYKTLCHTRPSPWKENSQYLKCFFFYSSSIYICYFYFLQNLHMLYVNRRILCLCLLAKRPTIVWMSLVLLELHRSKPTWVIINEQFSVTSIL